MSRTGEARMWWRMTILAVLVAACSSGGGDQGSVTTTSSGVLPTHSGTSTPDTSTPSNDTSTTSNSASTTPPQGSSEFDFDRVALIDPADLPVDDLPVAVPVGAPTPGVIQVLGTSAGGTLFHVRYDPRYFLTAAAFYEELIKREGYEATDWLIFPSSSHWILQIDGKKVQVRVASQPDFTHLEITYNE